MYCCPGLQKKSTHLQACRWLPGRIWSQPPNVQVPASILPFHIALFRRVNYCEEKLLYANLRWNLLSFQHFLFALLTIPSLGLWLWKRPGWGLGVLMHCAVSPGTAFTEQRVMWAMICTAGSGTKSGLFWLMNIELLSNSKLYPALQVSLSARGWAADRGTACEFVNLWLDDECAPNRALLVTQLRPCNMIISFSYLVLIVFLLKA